MGIHRTTFTMIGIKLKSQKSFFDEKFEEYTEGNGHSRLVLDYLDNKFAYFGFVVGESDEYGVLDPKECDLPSQFNITNLIQKAESLFGPGDYKVMIHHFNRWM